MKTAKQVYKEWLEEKLGNSKSWNKAGTLVYKARQMATAIRLPLMPKELAVIETQVLREHLLDK